MDFLPDATLARPIEGVNLTAHTFGKQIAAGPQPLTLVAFLRHYGCMFVREMIRDVKWAVATNPDYPNVLFVGQGDVEETRHLLKSTWPEAPTVCDPKRELYEQMGLARGTIYQMFGPSVWACHMRASFKGNFFGRLVGDPWLMPGAFVVEREGAIRWRHEFRHQGDHPDWAKIPVLAGRATDLPLHPKVAAPV